jgi:hypothetical protein
MKFRLLGFAFILLSLCALPKAEAAKECPVRHYNGACIQVITFAINPTTGTCCVYANPCEVPDGWVSSSSEPPPASFFIPPFYLPFCKFCPTRQGFGGPSADPNRSSTLDWHAHRAGPYFAFSVPCTEDGSSRR